MIIPRRADDMAAMTKTAAAAAVIIIFLLNLFLYIHITILIISRLPYLCNKGEQAGPALLFKKIGCDIIIT